MPRPTLLSPPSPTLSLLPSGHRLPWIPATFRPPIRSRPSDISNLSRRRRLRILLCAPSIPDGSSSGIPSAVAEAITSSAEAQQEPQQEQGFIEIGYVTSVHGIKGELRVKPTTDFPELRFSVPGRRWLKTRISGKESISEVALMEGRGHPGQKGWILSFGGIDSVDKAKQIVGSILLVRDEDRPTLEEGTFYTPDLVGMRVVLKETGRIVGTVLNVYNTGASDLLQVMLDATVDGQPHSASSEPEKSASGPRVWIPFVEAIVPDVDMVNREMRITPPKGLLELNVRSDLRPKKERRLTEWKEKKKLQQHLVAAKKKMCEVGQKHLLEGFSYGEKAQKSLLANHIVDINFKLFKHAVQSAAGNMPSDRYNFTEFINANSAALLKNALRVTQRSFLSCASERKNDKNYELHKEGYQVLRKSKAAVVIIINDEKSQQCSTESDDVSVGRSESMVRQFQELFLDCKKFLKMEEHDTCIPILLVSPANKIRSFEEILSENEYFGLDSEKVQFLEEEKLPIVSNIMDDNINKILLKSPWEIIQAPIGSGGVFSLLSNRKILDDLTAKGVEYVQVCSLSSASAVGNPLFLGLVKSRGADIGIRILEGGSKGDEEFDMIFSMRHLTRISKRMDKLQFHAVPEVHPHVELVDKEWVQVDPDEPNSLRVWCSIYSSLTTCSPDRICILQISA